MAFERLLADSLGTGNWTGAIGDIDEQIEDRLDTDFIAGATKAGAQDITFGASAVADADTLRIIQYHYSAKTDGTANDTCDLQDNLPDLNTRTQALLTASFVRQPGSFYDQTDATAAQMDALEVKLLSNQAGMPATVGHQVSHMSAHVTYCEAAPADGGIKQFRSAESATAGTTVTVTFDATATTDNLIILCCSFARGSGSDTIFTPSGYTLLQLAILGGSHIAHFYKISDGTETAATVTHGIAATQSMLRMYEMAWDGSTPTTQVGVDTLVFGDTPAITPTNSTDNAYLASYYTGDNTAADGIQFASDYTNVEQYPQDIATDLTSHGAFLKINQSGSQSVAFGSGAGFPGSPSAISVVFNKPTSGIEILRRRIEG